VGLIDLRTLEAAAQDAYRLDSAVAAAVATAPDALLFDGTSDTHLHAVGRTLWRRAAQRPQLVLGASSVAQASLAHWPDAAEAATSEHPVAAARSPVFLLVGSQSPVTAAQVRQAQGLFDEIAIDPGLLLNDDAALEALAHRCVGALAGGRSVMARTTPAAASGPAPLAVARICGELLARVLKRSPQVRRVGVAGGDTSSIALSALGAWALGWGGNLSAGVALTRVRADDPALDGIELMLKGGQMGPPDLFQRLLVGTR
jgi:uncharacterized protein YgbK (DUF1537 family)